MRIAINAIFLCTNPSEGYGYYAREVVGRLIQQHPEHEFILITDRPPEIDFGLLSNVSVVIASPKARHPLSIHYWYNVAAPAALRKYKPEVWLQPYGFCSLTTSIPQVLIVHDLAFLHYPNYIPWYHRRYYQLFTASFLRKATRICTVSDFSKNDIVQHYKVRAEKIMVLSGAARATFVPISWEEQLTIKDTYAKGHEFFLFVGGVHPRKNLLNLLKAFSQFKKWQKSNMQLLIVGRMAWQYADMVQKLKTYKYREDVVFLGYLPDETLVKITAAAYALVYPSLFEGFGLPILEAMQAGVPVITSNVSSMPEVAGDAALLASPTEPETIAKQMLALYKNENIRNQYIESGLQRATQFNWNQTADGYWEELLKAVKPQVD